MNRKLELTQILFLLVALAAAIVAIVGIFQFGLDLIHLAYAYVNGTVATEAPAMSHVVNAFLMTVIGKLVATVCYSLSGIKDKD